MKYLKSMLLVSSLMLMPVLAQALPDSFADLAEMQEPSVVNISTTKTVRVQPMPQTPFGGGSPFDQFFHDFFGNMPPQERHALGTGFIISANGYVVTNNHVIDGADEVVVKLSDGEEHPAKVVGADSKLDIALLKIDAKGLRPVKLGDSEKLRVGDWVVAIGNPFGLDQTVTAGIVSAKGRVIGAGPYDSFIQTDAAINPGNSGGPLFNARGEVVGINTAIYSRSGGNNGIGFAIPINLARSVFDELRTTGHVQRARLGVAIRDIDRDTMKAMGLKDRHGAMVAQVQAGSAADKAGIQAGDVIVGLDNEKIESAHDLPIRVARHKPGQKVNVHIIRNGKQMNIPVQVEAMSEETHASAHPENGGVSLGLRLSEMDHEDRKALHARVKHGLVVQQVRPRSPAAQAGIGRGDVIYKVNGKSVDSLDHFSKMVKKLKGGDVLRVLLDRHGDQVFVIIRLPKAPHG